MLARTLIALCLVAAPAAAERFPGPADSWHYGLQAPASRGLTRFAYVDATPAGAGRWTVRIACGQHVATTGREVLRVEADGVAEAGRMSAIGGTVTLPGGPPSAFLIDLGNDPDALRLKATFTDPRCASGWGELSSGD